MRHNNQLNGLNSAFCHLQKKVRDLRDQEVGYLKRNAVLKAFINFVFGSAPILVTLVSFGTYVYTDKANVLTADKVFVCISLFNLLRLPMHLLPYGITETLRLIVSVKRINKFLNCKEKNQRILEKPLADEDIAIEVREG